MRIVSIATHMPYVGIPHAGGQYYLRHAEILSETHDLTVICPWTPANAQAMDEPVHGSYRRFLVVPQNRRGALRRGARRSLWSRALTFVTMGSFLRAVLADERATELLRTADRIELQWFDAIALAPRLRRLVPGTPLTGVFHDVASQGYRRRARARDVPPVHRLLSVVRWWLSAPLERRVTPALDTAVVFSDKDAALLARRRAGDRIRVVLPPLDDEEMPLAPREQQPTAPDVLFVGALWRPENEDAALWLLRDVWPTVRQAVPHASLTVAGHGPTARLQVEVGRIDGVELTGSVPTLAPFYRRAAVVVVPMRQGAGVKFKTVVALLWGVPVVTTAVGAEGIGERNLFVAVEDEPAAFAHAVVGALQDPVRALQVAAAAQAWASARYSTATFRRALAELYR